MGNETAIYRDIDGISRSRSWDLQLARLAERQHGVVARAQLLSLGFSAEAIDVRLRGARLHRIHQGVYAVGRPRLTRAGRWMAAVLAGGADAALSDRHAAGLHALLRADYGPTNVTAPRKLHNRPGLRFHHRCLSPAEITAIDGIPVTTVARTIFDLAGAESRRSVERAMHEAEVQRTFDLRELDRILNRSPRARGVRIIRTVLAERSFGALNTREELEAAFIAFVRAESLPLPETNAWLRIADRWIEADCAWRDEKVIVELDSWQIHGTRRNFESDRERDRALHVAGWRPVRVTWRHLHGGRAALADDLRDLLGLRRRRQAS